MRPNDPLKLVLACLIALFLTVAAPASLIGSASAGNGAGNEVNQENNAEVDNVGGNSQSGDDTSNTDQSGGSASGDAVAGQVFGSTSAGDVSGMLPTVPPTSTSSLARRMGPTRRTLS